MKKTHLNLLLTATLSIVFLSCEKEQYLEQEITKETVQHSADELRTAFAKNLAPALVNKELRLFLKTEALKQFDGDYDIVFNMAKNNVVTEYGQTFYELLEANWEGEISLEEITTDFPTLNILIPNLLSAPVELWDAEKVIPLVAVKNSEQHQEGVEYLHAYNSKRQESRLPAFEEPLETTIVIESSERVAVVNQKEDGENARRVTEENWVPIFEEGENQYYVMSRNFLPQDKDLNSISGARTNSSDALVIPGISSQQRSNMWWAYVNTHNTSLGYARYMREALYYGSKGDQPLKVNIYDRLQLFRFRSRLAGERAADGWSEGSLELYCYVMHGGPNAQGFNKVLLTFTVPEALVILTTSRHKTTEDFLNALSPSTRPYWEQEINKYKSQGILAESHDGTISVRETFGLWMNWGGQILNWSMHKYGDRLNFKFIEHDDGEEVTQEKRYSVGFNASVGKKDVWNVGLNTQISGKTSIKYTNNSDQFGEYTVDYYSHYFVMVPPVNLGDIEFVLATY